MKEELNNIILEETAAVEDLLKSLEEQHKCILGGDTFAIEACVSNIEKCNRSVAEYEVKRRELTKGRSMREIVYELKDQELENNFRKIKRLLQEVIVQKESNELLIKQGLGFTNRILNIINPDRGHKTYNSYGKIAR